MMVMMMMMMMVVVVVMMIMMSYIYIHMAVDGDEDHYDQARSEAIGRVPKRGPYHLNATWSSSHCLMIFDAVFRLPLELPPP